MDMIRSIKIALILVFIALLGGHCKDRYVSPYNPPTQGYLVVEGYISGNTPTLYHLTRSISLAGEQNDVPPPVTGAKLQVEGSDNSFYPMSDRGNGYYGVDTLPLRSSLEYRLRIKTSDGQEFLSSYVAYKPTPAIDSVTWRADGGRGIQIYVNTHDPADTTRYYQWEYTETWEYHSGVQSTLMYVQSLDTLLPRTDSAQIYTCWQSDTSSAIYITSTAKQSQDVVSAFPLIYLPPDGVKTSVDYSINVRQYALTKDGYDLLTLMQKNTESLGTIFDALPSQITGNITCITNSSLPVIGWVSAGTVQQKRIFVNNTQVPSYYTITCATDTPVVNVKSRYGLDFIVQQYVPLSFDPDSSHVNVSAPTCADCRTKGGSTTKPSYWQ